MALPKQVARQAAEADRIVRNLNGANEAPLPPETSTDIAPQQAAPQAPPPPVAPPAPPQAQTPPPAPPAPPVQQTNEWETRYHTLQGKYNAEVPALQGQLQNAMTAMGNMGRELDALKDRVARAAAAPPPQPPRQVTENDVQTWGADMLDVIGRRASEEAQRLLQPLLAENTQLKEVVSRLEGTTVQVQQTQQQNREQMFWTRMVELVPNWEGMNSDPGFLAWLAQYDPMIGNTRKFMLDQAQQQLNADRAAAFFKGYASTLPPPPHVDPQRELARQASPNRNAGGGGQGYQPPANNQTVEIWSSQEVTDFYTDVSRGKYRSNPAEYQRMNEAITNAVAEGRVR